MSNPSTELARTVVTALRGSAVREVVLAPGSRNAPLSFALYDAQRATTATEPGRALVDAGVQAEAVPPRWSARPAPPWPTSSRR